MTPEQIPPASYSKSACRWYLGKGNRKVILSGVLWEVGHWYRSSSGVHMGFKEY